MWFKYVYEIQQRYRNEIYKENLISMLIFSSCDESSQLTFDLWGECIFFERAEYLQITIHVRPSVSLYESLFFYKESLHFYGAVVYNNRVFFWFFACWNRFVGWMRSNFADTIFSAEGKSLFWQ